MSVEGAAMIKGLSWLGTRTDHYPELITFCRETMGLEVDHEEEDFIVFKLPDGSKIEVFGPSDREHLHFETGPVAGFEVDDIETARERLEAGGADFIGPVHRWEPTGEAWSHFRAPDGNVYELTQAGSRQ
jgi:predicted enzyme related to lactoylglutathione lyase